MSRNNTYLIGNQFAKGNKPNETSFKKGFAPWNKGIKKSVKPNKGSWKKGRIGINWKPVGTISIRKDKNGTKRRWIKVKEPNIWFLYAKYIWIKSGKKIKTGLCLHHISNNSLDDRIENLILVSRQDHPKLHNRWNTKN